MQAFTADIEAHEKDLDRVEELKDKFVGTAKVGVINIRYPLNLMVVMVARVFKLVAIKYLVNRSSSPGL